MHINWSSSNLSCCTQAWRAEELRQRLEAMQQEELEARAQHIKRAEESHSSLNPRVGDSSRKPTTMLSGRARRHHVQCTKTKLSQSKGVTVSMPPCELNTTTGLISSQTLCREGQEDPR